MTVSHCSSHTCTHLHIPKPQRYSLSLNKRSRVKAVAGMLEASIAAYGAK